MDTVGVMVQRGEGKAVGMTVEDATDAITNFMEETAGYHIDYLCLDPLTGEVEIKLSRGFKIVFQYDSAKKRFRVIFC